MQNLRVRSCPVLSGSSPLHVNNVHLLSPVSSGAAPGPALTLPIGLPIAATGWQTDLSSHNPLCTHVATPGNTWKHLVRKIQKNPASSLCFCFSRVIFYLGQLVLICAPLDTKKYQHTKKGTNLVFCLAIMSTCTFLSFMAVPLL